MDICLDKAYSEWSDGPGVDHAPDTLRECTCFISTSAVFTSRALQ